MTPKRRGSRRERHKSLGLFHWKVHKTSTQTWRSFVIFGKSLASIRPHFLIIIKLLMHMEFILCSHHHECPLCCSLPSSSHLLLGHLTPPFQILMILDHVTVLPRLFSTLSDFSRDSSNIRKFSSNPTSKFTKWILYSTSQLLIKTVNKAGASKPEMLHHQFYNPSTKLEVSKFSEKIQILN